MSNIFSEPGAKNRSETATVCWWYTVIYIRDRTFQDSNSWQQFLFNPSYRHNILNFAVFTRVISHQKLKVYSKQILSPVQSIGPMSFIFIYSTRLQQRGQWCCWSENSCLGSNILTVSLIFSLVFYVSCYRVLKQDKKYQVMSQPFDNDRQYALTQVRFISTKDRMLRLLFCYNTQCHSKLL